MDILISIPTIIKKKKENIEFFVSTLPVITKGDFIDRLRNELDIDEACKGLSYPECFSLLYGGVVISVNSQIKRFELEGCIKECSEGKPFELNSFIENPYQCFSFDDGCICFLKEKEPNCKFIDNIGLRVIIKDTQ